jgi:hypothetical protein
MNENEAMLIWRNFIRLKDTDIDPPFVDAHDMLIDELDSKDVEGIPEWHQNEDRLCFMPRLKDKDSQICIQFLLNDERQWVFGSTIPLRTRIDRIGELPTCKFPKLPIQELRWRREVLETEMRIDLFTTLKDIKGMQFAIEWFADGDEFRDKVIESLPFLPTYKAFIYYKCWFHSQLLGETTLLQTFDDNKAVISLERCKHLAIYKQNKRIRNQIEKRTYLALFETTWDDRASKCGWHIEYEHEDLTTQFTLTR